MKRSLIFGFLVVAASSVLMVCSVSGKEKAALKADIEHDTKYNSATVKLTPEDFKTEGIQLGDSLKVTFSNGYVIDDVPYYNGYYVKDNAPVVVAYPGFEYVSVTYNNNGIWDKARLSEDDTVSFTVNQPGKYLAIQESLGQVYSFDRKDYDSDEEFCNFRALAGGSLKKDYFFRGASPVDNSRGRARYCDGLLKENKIDFTMDLADSEEDMGRYLSEKEFESSYSRMLYENDKIALLSMGSGYKSDAYKEKVVEGLRMMLHSEGPVYIHCMEGKDRTGFVCTLIEALAGADYEEMRSDYMATYGNYYGVTQEETPEKYNAISELYFDSFAAYLHGTEKPEELKKADYVKDAEKYLVEGGMTRAEIALLHDFIEE